MSRVELSVEQLVEKQKRQEAKKTAHRLEIREDLRKKFVGRTLTDLDVEHGRIVLNFEGEKFDVASWCDDYESGMTVNGRKLNS